MSEQFENLESGHEEVRALVERLREIHFDFNHPRYEEMNKLLMQSHHEHPEWIVSSMWNRLLGSTPNPGRPVAFDVSDGSVSAFIRKLAKEFLS